MSICTLNDEKGIKINMKKVIIYDFDGTLTPYSLPKFEILKKSNMTDGTQFLKLAQKRAEAENIDLYKAMYDTYFAIIKNAGFKLTDENFSLGYDNVEYNSGVIEFLNMLHQNNVSNYLLSSGLKVFLEKVSISSYFKEIYATTFTYNQDYEATGVEFLMSDENKVVAIKEILKKNNIDNEDCSSIIYIGDGPTDYYAMKYVKEHGGTSILVYQVLDSKDMQSIKEKNVVDFYTKADFSQNSELQDYVKRLCKIK